MEVHPEDTLNLDYEDLVSELDKFEKDAKSLQERIAQFMDDARQAMDVPSNSESEAEETEPATDTPAS
ncbi:MAG: hypothetical protein O2954_17550 [bacterium]|nr:hypothetical protein [bacterium]